MTLKPLAAALMLSGALLASAAHAAGCCDATKTDFPKVGGNLGNQNYSSLARINKGNVNQLGGAWLTRLEGGSVAQTQSSTAVAVNGTLFVETSQGNVYAVNGKTGAVKWSYKGGFGTLVRRGVAVGEGLVFTNAAGKRVIALDQNTGEVRWTRQLNEETGISSLKVAVTYHDGLIYVGSNDGNRGVGMALRASDGTTVWKFYGTPAEGEFGNDTWAGDSWKQGGASPWMHPAVDPELGLVYWTFGNARSGGNYAVDGSDREGQNLFANSIVAMDAKTGQRKWHFQSVHHDIWDMDNVMAPVLADVTVSGKKRKAVIYGAKTAVYFILDRETGQPIIPVDEKPVPQNAFQKTWPTQPFPRGDSMVPLCPTPDGPQKPVPNYETGCLYTPHTDKPVIMSPGTGGGMDWSALSYSQRTGYIYVGVGYINSAHSVPDGGVGFRPLGERKDGKVVALNPATNRIVWQKEMGWALTHGNGVLTTATDLMFIGQPDGNLIGMDVLNGRELWRFQTGAGVHTSPITYEVDGEQYVAVFAGGNGLPYADTARGDFLWAFKLGGNVPPAPPAVAPSRRQPITAAAVEGTVVNNTVSLARLFSAGAMGAVESTAQNAMAPQHLRVPVGTTVNFLNPASNAQPHCATQFFEGLFNTGPLAPGQSYSYTFTQPGEYFYNDCTNARSTGKVVVY